MDTKIREFTDRLDVICNHWDVSGLRQLLKDMKHHRAISYSSGSDKFLNLLIDSSYSILSSYLIYI